MYKYFIGALFLFFAQTAFSEEKMNVHMEIYQGESIDLYVEEITDLSLIVYREYPYLYEGTVEEYFPIIQHYASSQDGIACVVFDGNELVGVAIGMPLDLLRENYQRPFLKEKMDIHSYYYLGEFLLLKEYRRKGLGEKMYQIFEQAVLQKTHFSNLCLCKIVELSEYSPLPSAYRPADGFWRKLGFKEFKNLHFDGFWQNLGEDSNSPHTLNFWIKSSIDSL